MQPLPSLHISLMKKNSIANTIRRSIESSIELGHYLPGQLIDERTLAAEFSVSRTPIRQALQQLQGEGVIEILPRVGARVPKLDVKDLFVIFELLAELESVAAKFAARRITGQQADELRQALAACETAKGHENPIEYAETNRVFHEVIYAAAHNALLTDEIKKLRKRRRAYCLNRFDRPHGIERSLDEHVVISAAICAGDTHHASEAARDHILVGAHDFLDYVATLPEQPEFSAQRPRRQGAPRAAE